MDTLTSIAAVVAALVGIGLLLLVVFVAAVALAVVFGRKQMMKFLMGDPSTIHREIDMLQRANPGSGTDDIAKKLIARQALYTGGVGAVAGLGGGLTFLVGAPVDLVASMRRQMRMVQAITTLYGNDDLDFEMLQLKYATLVLGGSGAGAITGKLVMRTLVKAIGEAIPGLGAIPR
jgi:uncharacterized protein YneF (UPF0154 family)